MRLLRGASLGALACALGGCALIAGYDFGKWGEDPRDGGAGGSGGSTTSSTSSSTSTGFTSSSGTTSSSSGSTSSSSGTTTSSSGGTCNGTIAGSGPKVLRSGSAPVVSVAVDDAAIYFTTDLVAAQPSSVFRADKANPAMGSGFGLMVDTQARALVLDGVNAYWITTAAPPDSGDTLWRIPKVFGTSGTPMHASSKGTFGGIAVSGGTLYFTSTNEGASFPVPGIYSVAIAGGSLQQVLALPAGRVPREIVAGGVSLYVVVGTTATASDILKLDLTSKIPSTLSAGELNVRGLATDGAYIYWSSSAGLRKIPTAGGAAQTFGTPTMSGCGGLGIDAAYLYCTDNDLASVLQVPLADTSKILSAQASLPMTGVAADCSFVYFGQGTDLNRIPRL